MTIKKQNLKLDTGLGDYTEGISGFMFAAAQNILKQVWSHGSSL